MRKNYFVLTLLTFLLMAVYACNSVETTSAMLHNQTGNYAKAIEMAKAGIEKNPNDAEAYFQLGISYSMTKEMRLAYENFMKAAKIDPKRQKIAEDDILSNWARHFNLGVTEYGSMNLEGAAVEFFQATEADPRKVKSWLNLAMTYNALAATDSTYAEETYAAVDSLMAKVTEEDDDYGKALALAGRVMINKGQEEQAFSIFEKLMLDDPTNAEVVEDVAADFMQKGQYDIAARFLEMAVEGRRKTDTENFDTYYNLGVAYFQSKAYLQAIDAYQNALMLDEKSKDANYSLLVTYYSADLWDEAIMQGQKYVEQIAPDDARGYQILSLACNKKGMKKKAEDYFQKYTELTGQQ